MHDRLHHLLLLVYMCVCHDRFKTVLSNAVLDSDEIELPCRGGSGRENLLILNDDIMEDDLDISVNDAIVGASGDRFVGKVRMIRTWRNC